MTLQQAQKQLLIYKKQQVVIKKKVAELVAFIREQGGKPIDLLPHNSKRDKEIYQYFKKGKSFSEIASLYNLSNTRINTICKSIERRKKERKNPI